MTHASDAASDDPLMARLLSAGIDPDALARAAEAGRSLCAQTAAAEGSCLAPAHYLDFQRLIEELAGGSSA
ncbi:MAG: hypothetical protein JSW68_12010 [Burkholderiales bacterium]|nr:MAG: hypothetical protein JSW68_12010 [Burkholderiales bacterium]